MPVQLKIPSNPTQAQAIIIPDVSERNAGVATPSMAEFFNTFSSVLSFASLNTADATFSTINSLSLPEDGVMAGVSFINGANADGTDWAVWLIAPIVFNRTTGVVSVFSPVGPQPPAAQAGATSATWLAQYVASGDSILIQVAGAVGVDIKWSNFQFTNYNVRT